MKTISAYVKAPWKFDLREIDLPDTPPEGQILIRVEACGICGTDLTTAKQQATEWKAFGHEIAGLVERLGPGIEHFRIGQRVVLESSSFCGQCDLCRDGRVDLCNKAPNIGGSPAMGFSQYMCVPVNCIVPYEDLPAEVACLAEPAGVAFDMVKTADIQLGDRVCVIGPGPIALMAISLARHRGAEKIVCIGREHSKKRLEIAEQLGAKVIAYDGSLDKRNDLHHQFDHVLMTAPTQFIPPALSLLAYGGKMTYIGIGPGSGTISFDANDFHFRKLQFRASFASPGIYVPSVLKLLKAGIIPGQQLISHRFALRDIAKAMATCREDKANTVKVVIQPEGKD